MGFERFRDELIFDYSTKHGGISTGVYASMNLSFSTGDDPAAVNANYRLWCKGLGVDPARLAMVWQTHSTNVIRVDGPNAGEDMAACRVREVDGMVTDRPGVALVTSHADCVPLYFYDPVRRAIGLSHAGWRGTVGGMAAVTIRRMAEEYGCCPANLQARIGPCISQRYFECDRDVVDAVLRMPLWDDWSAAANGDSAESLCGYDRALPADICYYDSEKGKYHVSLSRLNRAVMMAAGIPAANIDMADTCTYAHEELYFSHRRQGSRRGGQAALLMMKE